MSYIGNQVTSVPHVVDVFSGDNSTTLFGPLVRAPAGTAAIAVFINGAYKTPGADYLLNGDYITFIIAPSSGTNNIVVHHLGNGTTTQVPSDGSVTGNKLAINSVRGNNIVAGTITNNLIATGTITSNLIALNQITGNLFAVNSLNASNVINELSITGNLIGTGAISANNFAGGGITSNVLSSNLQISTVRVAETVNVFTTGIGGNVNIDVANSTVYYFIANTSANVTFNFRANSTHSLDSLLNIGQTASVAIALKQGSTRYRANVFIDDQRANGIYWLGNSQPLYQTSQSQSIDAYNFTIIKTGSATYTVMASNSTFGQANGQGVTASGTVY